MEVERQSAAADLVIQDGEIEPLQVNGADSDPDDLADTNNNPSPNDKESGAGVVIVDGRITRKAKRRLRRNSGKDSKESTSGVVSVPQQDKNSRKSRAGRGRGLPKKGGAGGKGTWGKVGQVYDENDAECHDVNDPNYDSDNQADVALKTITPVLRGVDLHKAVEPIVHEYFEHGDTDEVVACLSELNISGCSRHAVPALAVTLSMEKKAQHKELTSILLSELYGKWQLSEEELSIAFHSVLTNLTDCCLDSPDAPQVVGQFIARAVADDVLPPVFLTQYKGKVEDDNIRVALDRAEILLSKEHSMSRLDNVWGTGGGLRPVKMLIKKMVLLLREYLLSSGDIQEATRCLQELEVPHFHHELVYEAVYMVLEDTGDRAANMMAKLLKYLYNSSIVTVDQLTTGFQRVFNSLPDIVLDVPYAYPILEKFVEICNKEGILTEDLKNKVPMRVRKRFVSEGDGGRFKE
ncbi:programmed cell death protein 4-like [Amphiura filiformis]|uniref:programmed cell death protein 4-like n=1 Tax=Amphiura filiformis TaxID=82378 RepID=UPI003B21B8CC